MRIHPATADDWADLKAMRLAALLDAPTAFGVTHATAAAYDEAQWRERASGAAGPRFWLAIDADEKPVGMIGGGTDRNGDYNLIGMWVTEARRGAGAAALLVRAVLAHARALGHARVVLDVAPDNVRAAGFYRKQGFTFLDAWEPLASHPHIRVQKMAWAAPAQWDHGDAVAV